MEGPFTLIRLLLKSCKGFLAAFEPQLTSLTPKGRRFYFHPNAHDPIDFTRHYGDLKEHAGTLYWLALRFLCESGWEPVTGAYQTSSEGRLSSRDFSLYPQIHLRKELE